MAPDVVPLYSGCALITEQATSRQCIVELTYYERDDGGLDLHLIYNGIPAPVWTMEALKAQEYRRCLFPEESPDGGERVIADPVNLDGSPRNKLRDKLARRSWLTVSAAG